MKKKYISPSMTIVEMKTQGILCGSITNNGDTLGVTISNEDSNWDEEGIY